MRHPPHTLLEVIIYGGFGGHVDIFSMGSYNMYAKSVVHSSNVNQIMAIIVRDGWTDDLRAGETTDELTTGQQ